MSSAGRWCRQGRCQRGGGRGCRCPGAGGSRHGSDSGPEPPDIAAQREIARLSGTPIAGPTALIEIGGLRLLTDPTFDGPGEYPVGERSLVKTEPAAWTPEQVGDVDAVLLSHDQHPDNLDRAGRAFLTTAPLVLTTTSAARRLGGTAVRLANWEHADLTRPDGTILRITGVPAQHGPEGTEHPTGESPDSC